MARLRVCPCRPVLWRSFTAGRAPDCGTLTIKPDLGRSVSTARLVGFAGGVGVESLVGWVRA